MERRNVTKHKGLIDRTALRSLLNHYHDIIRRRWNRSIPPQEILSDRWQRARDLGFGEGSSIYGSAYVYGNPSVGRNVWIGPNVILDGSGGLTIGSRVSISAGVAVYTHDSIGWALGKKDECSYEPTRIGDCVHIGHGAVVLRGSVIPSFTIVPALAKITRKSRRNPRTWTMEG